MKKILITIIDIYQKIPGPWHLACRHYPTCSNYTKKPQQEYGKIKGLKLGIKRVLKCNPLGTKGYDPVPHKEE